jgi:uncharacterized protein
MSVGPVQRDEATAGFFDGAAAGQFLLRQCAEGHFSEPPAAACTTCGRTELEWVPAAGGATLVSWAVSYGRPAGDEPPPRTVLAIGELDEGPWWWAQLGGREPDDGAQGESTPEDGGGLAVGQRLRLEFRRAGAEHEAVPVFVLA